jgi:hypothetical protein
MSNHKRNLCALCRNLDIQAFLLAAEPKVSRPNSTTVSSTLERAAEHATVPEFYQHQPNLASLKLAAQSCNLCSAIWKDCSRQRASSELTDAALEQGLGTEQIYIGALAWDANVSAVPHVVVHQRSSSSVASRSRWIACFEVCADYSSSSASSYLLASECN